MSYNVATTTIYTTITFLVLDFRYKLSVTGAVTVSVIDTNTKNIKLCK